MPKNLWYICSMYAHQLLKGNLQTIVLQLLTDHQRMYGYQITQKVKEQTQGKLVLTEGALYPTLHKLESQGLLTTEKVMVGKRLRKYYSLTEAGAAESVSRVKEFFAFVQTMQLIFGTDPGGLTR